MGTTDLRAAVEAAVQLEKDTALFYHSIAMGLGPRDIQEIYKITGGAQPPVQGSAPNPLGFANNPYFFISSECFETRN